MAFFCLCFFFNTKKLPVVSSAPGTFLSAPRNEFFRETYVERCLGVSFGEFPKPAGQADNWRVKCEEVMVNYLGKHRNFWPFF